MRNAIDRGVGVTHFKELACWRLAHELKKEIMAFTDTCPAKADRDFCDDIRASSRSATANISEGFGRHTHRDFARFLSIARASLYETDNHLQDAFDSRYLSESEHQRLTELLRRAIGAVSKLQSYLLRTPDRSSIQNRSSLR